MESEQGELTIASEQDIVTARTTIREVARGAGFGMAETTRIVTAVSELARNIFIYADSGAMTWETNHGGDDTKLEIIFADEGPGIPDIERALEEGHSTGEGMGFGLSGAQKLVDELVIDSEVGDGTTVTVRKYRR